MPAAHLCGRRLLFTVMLGSVYRYEECEICRLITPNPNKTAQIMGLDSLYTS